MNHIKQHHPKHLPEWIPWQGKCVYGYIHENGGYSGQRLKYATETLFRDNSLKSLWELLSELSLSLDGWSFLIGGIVLAVECAPTQERRATRDRDINDDEKIQILERQKLADKKLSAISKKANELADLLNDLEENGGKIPPETCCSLALTKRSIKKEGVALASCGKSFQEFQRKLSSYDTARFPKPKELIYQLALATQEHPTYREIFADTPWLCSVQSSWKDYVRVLMASFDDCQHIYGDAPSLSDAHWHALVRAMLIPNISLQTVAKGLKEL